MEQGNTASDPGDLPSLDFVFEQIEKRLEVQWSALDSLNTKLSILSGFGGVILAALLSAYDWLLDMPPIPLSLVFAAIVALVISLILAISAYRNTRYAYPPDPRGIREEYVSRPLVESKLRLLDTRVEAYEHNQQIASQKDKHLNRAILALLISVCLLACSFVLGLLPACVWRWLALIVDAVCSVIV